jgi:hypothetical protein
MAIIPQQRLFGWEKIEKLGDLERLRLVVEYMPDEDLMRKLEEIRNNGRDDYPVRATWNSVLAGVVFQHPSVEHLRRELDRNGQLRYMCGLDSVPTSRYSNTSIAISFSSKRNTSALSMVSTSPRRLAICTG